MKVVALELAAQKLRLFWPSVLHLCMGHQPENAIPGGDLPETS